MDNQIHEYFMAPISLIGAGSLERLAEYLKPMKLRKALIVTDAFLAQSKLMARVTGVLASVGLLYVMYDGVHPNPTVTNAQEALKLFADNGCDFLMSFGGGSPHDCAKAVAFLATNGGRINDYEGLNKLKKPSSLLFTINTTAGTGSELTRFCVITDEERHVKMTISDWRITPRIAVNDSTLMIDMPPSLTAATGMDALTHAIEAYISTNATPVTDCKALKAIELVANYLPTAVHNGKDLKAREMMINAAYLAGIAFNNASVGYVHSAAHQLGGFYNLPHGLCNAIMLPVVAEYNSAVTLEKFRDISEAFGIDTRNMSLEQSAQAAIIAIRTLSKAVGIPPGLREIKAFNENEIPLLAANALKDMCSLTNPRQATQQEMENLFRAAI